MTDEAKGAPETIDMPKAIWMQLDVQYHRLASWDLVQWCDTAFTTGTEYTRKDISDKRIEELEAANEKLFALNEGLIDQLRIEQTEARNEALEEAAKDIGTWAYNKSSAAGKLTSGAVFTTHTWQDARDVVLALKADTP